MNGTRTSGNPKLSFHSRRRKASGHGLTEFAVGLIVLIAFVFAPLFNIAIIPIRYLIVEGAMTEMAHRVVLAKSALRPTICLLKTHGLLRFRKSVP